MDYLQCRKILREYFSEVTYVDDEFSTELVTTSKGIISEDEVPEDMPLDAGVEPDFTDNEIEPVSDVEATGNLSKANGSEGTKLASTLALMKILEKLSENEFSGIQLIPIVYDETVSEQQLIEKMLKANLTVIDWDLGGGKKAFPIIKTMLDKVTRLKVVVVYTNGFESAKNSIEDIFGKIDYVIVEKHVICFQYSEYSKSLIFIVDKQYLNISGILDKVEEIFIQENGIMPVAVLDIADQLREKSGDLFGSFCKPFEDIYFLQMHYSEVANNEISNYLTDIIIKKIYSDVHTNPDLGKELLASKKKLLINVLNEKDVEERIRDCCDQLQECVSGENKVLLKLQVNLNSSLYHNVARNLESSEKLNWRDTIGAFKPVFRKLREEYINLKLQETIGDKEAANKFKADFSAIYTKLKRNIEKTAEDELNVYKKQVMPVLLQMLISRGPFLKSLPELVENMKYHKYENAEMEKILGAGKDKNDYELNNFMMNKIHFGDILYQKSTDEYLLCVTPPCDAFRPMKVDFEYTFIRGKIIPADQVKANHKESEHITIYPIETCGEKRQRQSCYIMWRLFDIVTFNLNNQSQFEEICTYSRQYKLDESYTRQIANKFISFYSRAGVDEIFVKNEKNLMSVFS